MNTHRVWLANWSNKTFIIVDYRNKTESMYCSWSLDNSSGDFGVMLVDTERNKKVRDIILPLGFLVEGEFNET